MPWLLPTLCFESRMLCPNTSPNLRVIIVLQKSLANALHWGNLEILAAKTRRHRHASQLRRHQLLGSPVEVPYSVLELVAWWHLGWIGNMATRPWQSPTNSWKHLTTMEDNSLLIQACLHNVSRIQHKQLRSNDFKIFIRMVIQAFVRQGLVMTCLDCWYYWYCMVLYDQYLTTTSRDQKCLQAALLTLHDATIAWSLANLCQVASISVAKNGSYLIRGAFSGHTSSPGLS